MSAGRSNLCFVMHAQFPLPICRRAREFRHGFKLLVLTVALTAPVVAVGQESQSRPPDVHEHVAVTAPMLTPTREASGTAWLPDITPMYGVHRPWRGWDVRLDGVGFVEALYEPLDRHRTGGSSTRQVAGINWGMAMARRKLGGGRFGIRSMLSAEPWTLTSCGALNLLATGEVCDGDTVHDRQQAHDLFMELAVDYERPLHGHWKWQVYAGLAGEPALGPPGYPHRASAIVNPIRPVAHHWLDSTHVTFGVVTLAFHNQRWKVEASTFNGREADERRVDLDLGTFDSAAARLSFLPSERLAFQVSAARLREVGTDFPLPSQPPVVRATASAMYHVPLGAGGIWATTLAYGANHASARSPGGTPTAATTHAALLETSVTVAGRHTVFGRSEIAQMPAHDLHVLEYGTSVFAVGKLQIGYVRHRRATKGLVPGVGGTLSLSVLSPELAPRYSGRTARGFDIFLILQTSRHQM